MDIRYRKRIKKDIKRRKKLLGNSYQKLVLKSILKNSKLPLNVQHYAKYQLSKKYSKISLSNVNRFCILSSNFRAVFKRYGLSRGYLKEYARLGRIIGLHKK